MKEIIPYSAIPGYEFTGNNYDRQKIVVPINAERILEAISNGIVPYNSTLSVDFFPRYGTAISLGFNHCSVNTFKKYKDLFIQNINSPYIESLFFNCCYGYYTKHATSKGKLLIDFGMNKDIYFDLQHIHITQSKNFLGMTPLIACENVILIQYLLDHGANPKLPYQPDLYLDKLLPHMQSLNQFKSFFVAEVSQENIYLNNLERIGVVKSKSGIDDHYKHLDAVADGLYHKIKKGLAPQSTIEDAYSLAKKNGMSTKMQLLQSYLPESPDKLKKAYEEIVFLEKENLENAIKLARQAIKEDNSYLFDNLENHPQLIYTLKEKRKNLLLYAIQENNLRYTEKIIKLNLLDKVNTGVSQDNYLEFAVMKGQGKLAELLLENGYYNPKKFTTSGGHYLVDYFINKGFSKLAFKLYLKGFPYSSNNPKIEKLFQKEAKLLRNETIDTQDNVQTDRPKIKLL